MLDFLKKLFANPESVEITPEFLSFFELFEKTSNNYFLTGNAGTGKSTLINYFRYKTKKKIVVLAPTGLAAINVRGQTLHSFFHFPPRMVTPEVIKNIRADVTLYKQIDTIVIDEASMVRADLLDGIDLFLRRFGKDPKEPFGGTQIILVGDLFQLPPVVSNMEREIMQLTYDTPFFFSANAFLSGRFKKLELSKIFRQDDEQFISILNSVRAGNANLETLAPLNQRVQPKTGSFNTKQAVTLTTTNQVANTINQSELLHLPGVDVVFNAVADGEFPAKDAYVPVELELRLRKGARVMFVKNGAKWVNGTLGTVQELSSDEIKVKIEETGEVVKVEKEEWEHVKYQLDEMSNSVEANVMGKLKQYPLRLAWAITIHKSQGMTFNRVNIDYSRAPFAHGQTYVALSRCRTLGGITLSKPISPHNAIVDPQVVAYMTGEITI